MQIFASVFEHNHRIVYSLIENVKDISEIKHPAVRAIFQFMGVSDGVEVHHDGDLLQGQVWGQVHHLL